MQMAVVLQQLPPWSIKVVKWAAAVCSDQRSRVLLIGQSWMQMHVPAANAATLEEDSACELSDAARFHCRKCRWVGLDQWLSKVLLMCLVYSIHQGRPDAQNKWQESTNWGLAASKGGVGICSICRL